MLGNLVNSENNIYEMEIGDTKYLYRVDGPEALEPYGDTIEKTSYHISATYWKKDDLYPLPRTVKECILGERISEKRKILEKLIVDEIQDTNNVGGRNR